MKVNKKLIAVIIVGMFLVIATYFMGNNDTSDETDDEVSDERNQEIDILKSEVERLGENLFRAEKFILDSELAEDYIPSDDILYKAIEEDQFAVLYQGELDNKKEHYLIVSAVLPNYNGHLFIPSLQPANGITFDYYSYNEINYFGGILTDQEIEEIQVFQNTKTHQASILPLDEDLYAWYSIFPSDRPELLKIQALDKNGDILLEQSYGK